VSSVSLDLSVSGMPAAGSDSAKFCAVSSAVIVVGVVVFVDASSVAVLDEYLSNAVLGLVATLTQT